MRQYYANIDEQLVEAIMASYERAETVFRTANVIVESIGKSTSEKNAQATVMEVVIIEISGGLTWELLHVELKAESENELRQKLEIHIGI